MTFTVLALLGVLSVLLVTGSVTARGAKYVLTASPANQSVSAGSAARFRIEISASGRFHGAVQLSVAGVPDGVLQSLSASVVQLSKTHPAASVDLTLSTTAGAPTGAFQIDLLGRNGNHLETSSLTLQIGPAAKPAAGPAPSTDPGSAAFKVSGGTVGVLAPGATLPIALQLDNPSSQPLTVRALRVTLVSTSNPACRTSNFSIRQYSGHAGRPVPARQRRTLAELGVPTASWPQLQMLNLATNQDACKAVILTLRYAGSGG